MKAELSALMDDDLDERAAAVVLDGLARDGALRRDWQDYHRIRDALKEPGLFELSPDFTARCMAALEDEPTVLAPRPSSAAHARAKASPLRFALPLAASVMGVGVVAWVAQAVQGPRELLVAVPTPPAQAVQATMTSVATAGNAGRGAQALAASAYSSYVGAPVRVQAVSQMREYVVAHEGYSPWVAVQGAARYQAGMSEARQEAGQ